MRHMRVGANLALSTTRSTEIGAGFQHALCSCLPIQHHTVSLKEVNYLFPLYLYPQAEEEEEKPRSDLAHSRKPNLHPRLLRVLVDTYGRRVTAEAAFCYVYAILYTPSYRSSYAGLLKIDFPRIPFPAEVAVFEATAALGERLVALHLLESPELDSPSARFEGEGDNHVAGKKSDGFAYDPDTASIGINATQRFAPIPPALWEYRIGGYQVLEKWLKDRKGRRLSTDDIQTYCRIATALAKTIEIQAELDELYPAVEENLLDIRLDR